MFYPSLRDVWGTEFIYFDDYVIFIIILSFRVVFATMFAALTAGNVSSMAPDFLAAKISAARIFEILDLVPPIDSFSKEGDQLVRRLFNSFYYSN